MSFYVKTTCIKRSYLWSNSKRRKIGRSENLASQDETSCGLSQGEFDKTEDFNFRNFCWSIKSRLILGRGGKEIYLKCNDVI